MCVAVTATTPLPPTPSVTMVAPAPASSAAYTGPLVEGMTGWDTGLEGPSRLYDFPKYYQTGFVALVPEAMKLVKDTEVTFTCPVGHDGDCDAAVFLYTCTPCAHEDGRVPQTLAQAGFERTACGPNFGTGKAAALSHHMASHRMAMAAGTTYTLTLEGDAEWLMFAISEKAVTDCSALGVSECGSSAGLCLWKNNECIENLCHVRYGPFYGCAAETCVDRDFVTPPPPPTPTVCDPTPLPAVNGWIEYPCVDHVKDVPYQQRDVVDGNKVPKYDAVAGPLPYCQNICVSEVVGCVGFHHHKHPNGHEVCAFYTDAATFTNPNTQNGTGGVLMERAPIVCDPTPLPAVNGWIEYPCVDHVKDVPYQQRDVVDGNKVPKYDAVAGPLPYCQNICLSEVVGCVGFHHHKHPNGHEVCAFYTDAATFTNPNTQNGTGGVLMERA